MNLSHQNYSAMVQELSGCGFGERAQEAVKKLSFNEMMELNECLEDFVYRHPHPSLIQWYKSYHIAVQNMDSLRAAELLSEYLHLEADLLN